MKQTSWRTIGWHWYVLSFLIVAIATIALYVPFFNNAFVFDDHNFFTNLAVYSYAATPFSLAPRNFPYFTLGFTEVIWKSIEAQRIVSLLIHLLNALVLFRLLTRWLEEIGRLPANKSLLLGLIGSLFFAIHPVAVYGAGYLAQRTTLLATFFSLMSLWFYWRSLERNRVTDAITAALFYALAIYSKEHAIMLPAAALLLTALHGAPWRKNLVKAAVFTALCIPPAILVVLAVKGIIGTAYEPDSAKFLIAIPLADSPAMQWLISAATQTGAFFKYLQSWLLPDVRMMSADIRVDFIAGWTVAWITTKLLAFFAFAVAGAFLLRRGGKLGLIGWGMLYTWLLFATELSSVRFQEPFVLYRSYLWAPGIALALTACVAEMNRKFLAICVLLTAPLLFLSAQERLTSLSSDLAVWQDAAAKLPSDTTPGAGRIYYNRGRLLFGMKRYTEAIADMNRVIALHPDLSEAYRYKGLAAMALQNGSLAMDCFDRAIQLNPDFGSAYYARGQLREHLGRREEALADYTRSLTLGILIAKPKIEALTIQP